MKGIKEFARAIAWTVAVWASLIALLFVNYNWDVFTQFVKNFTGETAIMLLFPTFVAGLVCMRLWPRKTKKS